MLLTVPCLLAGQEGEKAAPFPGCCATVKVQKQRLGTNNKIQLVLHSVITFPRCFLIIWGSGCQPLEIGAPLAHFLGSSRASLPVNRPPTRILVSRSPRLSLFARYLSVDSVLISLIFIKTSFLPMVSYVHPIPTLTSFTYSWGRLLYPRKGLHVPQRKLHASPEKDSCTPREGFIYPREGFMYPMEGFMYRQ